MKRFLLLTLTLFLCYFPLSATTASWTDEETGLTWNFEYGTSGLEDGTAVLTGISGDIPANLVIPSTVDAYQIVSIGRSAFYNKTVITSVTIPEGVTTIENYAFEWCSNMSSITLPNSLTDVKSGAFSQTRIGDIYVKKIQTWFKICSGNPFQRMDFYDGSNVIKKLYVNGELMTEIEIPNEITTIPDYAFSGFPLLKSVVIHDGVTSIGRDAFSSCFGLTSVTLPTGLTSIGADAFYYCSGLTSITIPESVTSIGSFAFYYCSSLSYISIPENVTTIGSYALDIPIVEFKNETPCTWSNNMFNQKTPIIVVPDAAVNTYANTSGWSTYRNSIIKASDYDLKTVEVTAKPNGSDLMEKFDNLQGVVRLKVSGTINSYDMWAIRSKMTNLRELDLKDVSIVANDYEYYTGCCSHDNEFGANFFRDSKIVSVVMPTTVTSIGASAFYGCKDLSEVTNLENVTTIGEEAFYNCSSLNGLPAMNFLKKIEKNAFYGCTNLKMLPEMTSLEYIGESAFANCSRLYEAVLPNGLTYLGQSAFRYCSALTAIHIPDGVTEIYDGTFYECRMLTEVRFSPKTRAIGGGGLDSYMGAFSGCYNLTAVCLPSSLRSLSSYAFSNCSSLKEIYAYMPDVPAVTSNTFGGYSGKTLYVPAFLWSKYRYDTNWRNFTTVQSVELKEGDYTYIYTNNDLTFDEGVERITKDTPDVEIGRQGGIIVEGDDVQKFDEVEQNKNDYSGASLIGTDTNLSVNKLSVKIQVQPDRWYFFCFPFDVTIAECDYPGQSVWRMYDGQTRATNGSGGWKDVEGETLTGRKGYIFQSSEYGTLTVTFEQPTFGSDRTCELNAYLADNKADASWNLVGNPYSSFYDFQAEDFGSPITVWNGSSYQAYRPGDDDYHLQPYEAFFVQRPEDASQIAFAPERRETYRQSEAKKAHQAKARHLKGLNPERRMVNLTISDNDSVAVDKTRLVMNQKAERAYELACDAAKFISEDAVAQLYTLEGDVQMAINERPVEGDIRLGYVAKKAGTLRIEASRMDVPMVLVDTKTNTTFDFSLGAYEFQTAAGTFNQRFMLRLSNEATAIQTLTEKTGVAVGTQDGGLNIGGAEGKSVYVYAANGTLVAQQTGNGFVALGGGVYVVSVDGVNVKVLVK